MGGEFNGVLVVIALTMNSEDCLSTNGLSERMQRLEFDLKTQPRPSQRFDLS